MSETIQQPALAREAATKIAGSVLAGQHDNVKSQLDVLRRTRASRGGVGAPLDIPAEIEARGMGLTLEPGKGEGWRIGRSRADGDV